MSLNSVGNRWDAVAAFDQKIYVFFRVQQFLKLFVLMARAIIACFFIGYILTVNQKMVKHHYIWLHKMVMWK